MLQGVSVCLSGLIQFFSYGGNFYHFRHGVSIQRLYCKWSIYMHVNVFMYACGSILVETRPTQMRTHTHMHTLCEVLNLSLCVKYSVLTVLVACEVHASVLLLRALLPPALIILHTLHNVTHTLDSRQLCSRSITDPHTVLLLWYSFSVN